MRTNNLKFFNNVEGPIERFILFNNMYQYIFKIKCKLQTENI